MAGNGQIGFSGDGGPATKATFWGPDAVAFDHTGNLVVADFLNGRVRVVAASTGTFYGQSMTAGDIYTVAGNGKAGSSGDGGPATSAALRDPVAVAVDATGNLMIAGLDHQVRTVAASTGTFYGQSMTAGDIYTVAGNGTAGFAGDGGPAISAALRDPAAVAVDATGNLVIADEGNNRVRVVAARTGTFYGQSMTTGDIYTVAGNGSHGIPGDGGSAIKASIWGPAGVAIDGAGNLVIADEGNARVRVVAATTRTFYGRSMTAGDIYTVAGTGTRGFSGDGGPATKAELDPYGVALDGAGNLVITDDDAERVRIVTG